MIISMDDGKNRENTRGNSSHLFSRSVMYTSLLICEEFVLFFLIDSLINQLKIQLTQNVLFM